MQECFDETYRILKLGGRCCYVIGNSKLKKIEILNAEVFAESLQYSGFMIDRIIKREIPSKMLPSTRDSVSGQLVKATGENLIKSYGKRTHIKTTFLSISRAA